MLKPTQPIPGQRVAARPAIIAQSARALFTLEAAQSAGLPMPDDYTVHATFISLVFDHPHQLKAWAAYAQVDVTLDHTVPGFLVHRADMKLWDVELHVIAAGRAGSAVA